MRAKSTSSEESGSFSSSVSCFVGVALELGVRLLEGCLPVSLALVPELILRLLSRSSPVSLRCILRLLRSDSNSRQSAVLEMNADLENHRWILFRPEFQSETERGRRVVVCEVDSAVIHCERCRECIMRIACKGGEGSVLMAG